MISRQQKVSKAQPRYKYENHIEIFWKQNGREIGKVVHSKLHKDESEKSHGKPLISSKSIYKQVYKYTDRTQRNSHIIDKIKHQKMYTHNKAQLHKC